MTDTLEQTIAGLITPLVEACAAHARGRNSDDDILAISLPMSPKGTIACTTFEADNNHEELLRQALNDLGMRQASQLQRLLRDNLPGLAIGYYRLRFAICRDGQRMKISYNAFGKASSYPDFPEVLVGLLAELPELLRDVAEPGKRLFEFDHLYNIRAASPEDAMQIYLALHETPSLREGTLDRLETFTVTERHSSDRLIESVTQRREARREK